MASMLLLLISNIWFCTQPLGIKLYDINAITTNFDSSGRIAVSCTRARYAFRQGKAMLLGLSPVSEKAFGLCILRIIYLHTSCCYWT